jgi:hypothetical protein
MEVQKQQGCLLIPFAEEIEFPGHQISKITLKGC